MDQQHRSLVLCIGLISLILVSFTLPGVLLPGPISVQSTSPPDEFEPLSEHVLLIVLDGVPRVIFDDAEMMPFISSFHEIGVKVPVQTSKLTLTGACVKEMATGRNAVPMDAIRNWEVNNEVRNDPFYHAEYIGHSVAFTGFYVWANMYPEALFTHQTSPDYGFEDIHQADDHALGVVEEWMTTNQHNLMVAHLGGTDHAAHIHGLDSSVYQERLNQLDRQVEDLFSKVPDDWTVLLTSDHGLTNYGGHALGTGAAAEEVYLFANGKGISSPKELSEPIEQRDISLLISSLMNLPLPVSSDAAIPLDLLDLTEQERKAYELWNWRNIVAHHDFMKAGGGKHVDGLSDQPEWALLEGEPLSLPVWPMTATLMAGLGLFTLARSRGWQSPLRLEKVSYQSSILLAMCLMFVFLLTVGRESEYSSTVRWARKILGAFAFVGITCWLVIDRHRFKDLRVSTPILTVLVLLFFYPETRYSMIAVSISPFALFLLWTKGKKYFSTQEQIGLSVILGLIAYHILDYLPRFLTGMSLQSLVGLDVLYKPMQRLVHASMPSEPFTLGLFWLTAVMVIFTKREREAMRFDRKPITSISVIIVLATIQTNITDRILLLFIAVSIFYGRNKTCAETFENSLGITPLEAVIVAWIGPTWGFYPALVVLFLGRVAPQLRDMIEQTLREGPNEWGGNAKALVLGISGVCMLFFVWFHFSLLTPLGLLEYNPSKIIVTGGFFGARSDPSIVWMGLMIVGPPLLGLAHVYRAWSAYGPNDIVLLIMAFFMLSHAAVYWTSTLYTEYFLMLSTALLFYSTIIVIGLFTEYIPALLSPAADRIELEEA